MRRRPAGRAEARRRRRLRGRPPLGERRLEGGPGPGAAGRTLRRLESGGGGSGCGGCGSCSREWRGGKGRRGRLPAEPGGASPPRPAAAPGAPALFVPRRAVPKLGGKRLGRAGSGRRRSRNSSGGWGPGGAGAGRAGLCLATAAAPPWRAAGSGGSSGSVGGFYRRFGSSAAPRERGWREDPTRRLLLDAFSLLETTLSLLRKTLELCWFVFFF